MAQFQVIIQDDCTVVVNTLDDVDVVTQVEESTIIVLPDDTEVTVVEQPTQVVEAEDGSVIVSDTGVQGPAAEENVAFATRIDFIGADVIYRAEGFPGTLDATNGWRIRQITFVGPEDDVEIRWAEGSSDFNKVWDDHLSYTYI